MGTPDTTLGKLGLRDDGKICILPDSPHSATLIERIVRQASDSALFLGFATKERAPRQLHEFMGSEDTVMTLERVGHESATLRNLISDLRSKAGLTEDNIIDLPPALLINAIASAFMVGKPVVKPRA